jgi:ribosome maturation factor RimP
LECAGALAQRGTAPGLGPVREKMQTLQQMKRKTEIRPAGLDGLDRSARAARPSRPPAGLRAALTPEIQAELAAIASGAGCELLAAEWKGGVLRLILDRPAAAVSTAALDTAASPEAGGVTLGDCEHVSKQVSAFLDVADFGGGHYVLEVSSPGLDRQLYRPNDYQRFRGRLARVTFDDPETRRKRTVVGRLAELDEAAGTLTLAAGEPRQQLVAIPLHTIRLARLEIELERKS